MGLLVQTSPLSDTVQSSDSSTYENQLTCNGATPPLNWVTTSSSGAFIVSPGGAVGTSGTVEVGSYTSSGTMTDSASNSGVWSFTLTVVNMLTPQAAVTPVTPLPPTGLEVLVPFQIDPATGMIATAKDYATVLEQHVLTILMTSPSERVMLPTYGAGMRNQVFTPITRGLPSTLQNDIKNLLQAWEPAISVLSVDVQADGVYQNVLNVTVTFTALPFTGPQTITVSAGGALASAIIGTQADWNPPTESFS